MFEESSLPYLAVVQNTARLIYLSKKLDHKDPREPAYDLLSEYIKLMTWFEGLGSRKGAPLLKKSPGLEN